MSFNLKNRSFLKEIDFTPAELRYLLRLSEALEDRPSTPAPRAGGWRARRSR